MYANYSMTVLTRQVVRTNQVDYLMISWFCEGCGGYQRMNDETQTKDMVFSVFCSLIGRNCMTSQAGGYIIKQWTVGLIISSKTSRIQRCYFIKCCLKRLLIVQFKATEHQVCLVMSPKTKFPLKQRTDT